MLSISCNSANQETENPYALKAISTGNVEGFIIPKAYFDSLHNQYGKNDECIVCFDPTPSELEQFEIALSVFLPEWSANIFSTHLAQEMIEEGYIAFSSLDKKTLDKSFNRYYQGLTKYRDSNLSLENGRYLRVWIVDKKINEPSLRDEEHRGSFLEEMLVIYDLQNDKILEADPGYALYGTTYKR